ncbi:MAG TPA: alpha/beta hydrolase [Actinoplanes sp.]|nr:alpha/beta hydrolase [Actinoplanes sp.]
MLAAVLVSTGCTLPVFAPDDADSPGATAADIPSAVGAPASWRACPEVAREVAGRAAQGVSYDCATIAVPQDWSAPDAGGTYEVALLRVRSAAQRNRIGSLVINPGGPGGSGVDIAVYLSYGGLPAAITDRFDIVGFDPRGVHRSSPVRCIGDALQDASFAADPDPATTAEFAEAVALNRRIVTGCDETYGRRLSLFSTEQAAHDLEAIRAAVGDDKLTYLGYSYGTLLGATYAQLHPAKVRAMVLDGAIDPRQGYVTSAEAQANGFERAFANFTRWCRDTPAKCPLAPSARAAVTDAIATGETAPVRGGDGRAATDGWILLAVVASLYTEAGWAQLAKAVDDLRRGDPAGVFALADAYADRDPKGTYSNQGDANLAVNCTDAASVPTVQQVRQLQGRWRAKYPLFGAPIALGLLPCVLWPGRRDPYPTGPARGAPPIVVIGTTGDPATPYENTARLAEMLGVGRVLTWQGEGHTAYPDTPCITTAVNRYLIDLRVPAQGLRCPAR